MSAAPPLKVISSKATQALLADLVTAFAQAHPEQPAVDLESVGGVDAAKRVQAGEFFDLVVLASDAIDRLIASGHLAGESKVDLARSPVALAVQAGQAPPDIGIEAALRAALLAAERIGVSTGPSGVAVTRLFERWGLGETLGPRTVTAPPGVPVGSLVASGAVTLGFQQLSELQDLPGITVLGPLPEAVQIITTFAVARTPQCTQPQAAQALLAFLASAEAADAKRARGMMPA